MTVVGVVLILIAVLVVLGALMGGSASHVEFSLGGIDVSMSATAVFVLGLATALIFASGLELLRLGLGRSLARRRELKRARAVVTGDHQRHEIPQADAATAATGTTTADGDEAGAANEAVSPDQSGGSASRAGMDTEPGVAPEQGRGHGAHKAT
jgi:uncharacterized membrane protein